jgi:hypothetical protein
MSRISAAAAYPDDGFPLFIHDVTVSTTSGGANPVLFASK